MSDLPASHNPTKSTPCLFDDRRRKNRNTEHIQSLIQIY